VLSDAKDFLDWIANDERGRSYSLGILTNSPIRTVETTVPLTGIHNLFQWFVSCQDIGVEKPGGYSSSGKVQ
jgi:FMN phosphatase YigB (HAD superfamily)